MCSIFTRKINMKLYKYIISGFFFLVGNNYCFSQIEEPKSNFKKIIFKYKNDSNYKFDERGIYADTFLLKKDFPKLQYQVIKSPQDSLKKIGFILLSKLNTQDKYNLRDILMQYNSTKILEYNVSKKRVTSTKNYLDDPVARKFVADVLKVEFLDICRPSYSTITYKKNLKYIAENAVMNEEYSYADNIIAWEENMPNIGVFNYLQDGYSYTNLVLVDPNLDLYINPTFLFANCEYGVKKVVSLFVTCELVSVRYE